VAAASELDRLLDQHHRNAVVNRIEDPAILADESLLDRFRQRLTSAVADPAGCDVFTQLLQQVGRSELYRLLRLRQTRISRSSSLTPMLISSHAIC